jgi:hypothetical protein
VIRARNDNYDVSNTWRERKRRNRGKRKQRKKNSTGQIPVFTPHPSCELSSALSSTYDFLM